MSEPTTIFASVARLTGGKGGPIFRACVAVTRSNDQAVLHKGLGAARDWRGPSLDLTVYFDNAHDAWAWVALECKRLALEVAQ